MRKIVSLTSHGRRVTETLPKMLESIHRMSGLEPDAVVLYLSENDYGLLDKNLLIRYSDLDIRLTDDIGSYRKYLALTEREFDDDTVFIADDDILYRGDTYDALNRLTRPEDENVIYACTISVPVNGLLSEYVIPRNPTDAEYGLYWLWTNNGVLVPPRTMRTDAQLFRDGFNAVPTDDSAFVSVYCNMSGIRCRTANIQQACIDFEGNSRLSDTNRGRFRTHLQQSAACLNHPDRQHITISTSSPRPNADTIESLFTEQTLKPDKVILTISESQKVSRKLSDLTEKYNLVIQRTDKDPDVMRWIPDTDADDLLAVTDLNTVTDTLTEDLFNQYHTHGTFTRNTRAAYIPKFGYRHLIDTTHAPVIRKHTDGLDTTSDDLQLELTKTVLTQVINNP